MDNLGPGEPTRQQVTRIQHLICIVVQHAEIILFAVSKHGSCLMLYCAVNPYPEQQVWTLPTILTVCRVLAIPVLIKGASHCSHVIDRC